MSIPLLSTLIFFPIVGGLSLLIVPRGNTATIRLMALIVSLVEFCLSLPLLLLWHTGRNRTAMSPADMH